MNTLQLETPYEDIYSSGFQQLLTDTPGAVVIDVRTADEYHSGKIPTAINIDVMDEDFTDKIRALDRSKTYFVYCYSGGRSARACDIMSRHGLKVYNLAGGISHWVGEVI